MKKWILSIGLVLASLGAIASDEESKENTIRIIVSKGNYTPEKKYKFETFRIEGIPVIAYSKQALKSTYATVVWEPNGDLFLEHRRDESLRVFLQNFPRPESVDDGLPGGYATILLTLDESWEVKTSSFTIPVPWFCGDHDGYTGPCILLRKRFKVKLKNAEREESIVIRSSDTDFAVPDEE